MFKNLQNRKTIEIMNTTNLLEKIASYKRATQSLIDRTEEYEKFIKDHVPFNFWKKFGLRECGGYDSRYHLSIDGKMVPPTTDRFLRGFYWSGDFNYWIAYCSANNLVEWANNLPALIEEAAASIEKTGNLAEEALQKVTIPDAESADQ